MAGYQFTHYEGYSRKQAKGSSKRSLSEIAAEADRDVGNHPHVEVALKPHYFEGLPFQSFFDAQKAISSAADQSKSTQVTIDKKTGEEKRLSKKVRADSNVAIGFIASYPLSIDQLDSMGKAERDEAQERLEKWEQDNIEFAKQEFGEERVLCGTRHVDEGYYHIHLMIGDQKPTDDFKTLHKGEIARKSVQGNDRSKEGKRIGNQAYKKEMRSYQDRYFETVGAPNGLSRIGPGRERLTRKQWISVQKQMDSIRSAYERSNGVLNEAKANAEKLLKGAENNKYSITLEARNEAMDIIEKAYVDAEAEAEKLKDHIMNAVTAEAESKRAEVNAMIQETKNLADETNKKAKNANKRIKEATQREKLAEEKMLKANKKLKAANQKQEKLSSFAGIVGTVFGVGKSIRNKTLKEINELRNKLSRVEKDLKTSKENSLRYRKTINKLQNMAPEALERLQACNDMISELSDDNTRLEATRELHKLIEQNSRTLSGNSSVGQLLKDHQDKLEERFKAQEKSKSERESKYEYDRHLKCS